MQVATWNVNSIRARLDRVLDWLDRRRPDVLCMQETKVADDAFPREPFEERGYRLAVHGQRTYNGVAICARSDLEDVAPGLADGEEDDASRLLAATVGDLRVLSVYVPNGQSPESPRFAYKLAWLRRLRRLLERTASPSDPLLVLGDFNVAPDERDVHDPEAWRGKVHFHPLEHEALAEVMAWGLVDLFRRQEPGGGFYTWWDYRALSFPRNAGLRIDLALGTEAAARRVTRVAIDRDERKGQKPSDHVPVVVTLA